MMQSPRWRSSRGRCRLESHATTLNPGVESHAAHRHPDEEIIIVKEGMVEATINGVAQTAGPGSIFFFASNDLHGLRNAGDTSATYFVVRFITEATPRSSSEG
ncbi:MAG: cupin domain-containing protein [Opitutaceae bacterium]